MAKKQPKPEIPTLPLVPDPIVVDPRSPLHLEVAYRWHRGEEAIAIQVFRDAHPEEERPDVPEAMERCAEIAAKGPVPADYRPPGADLEPTPMEQVVHPPDPAYLPTEHPEPLPDVVTEAARRYEVRGSDEIEHTFTLTETERVAMFIRGTDQNHRVAEMVDEHAAIKSRLKKEMAAAEAERDRLLDCAKSGAEKRRVKVTRVADMHTRMIEFRLDDGSVISSVPLADDDRQLGLYLRHVRAGAVVSELIAGLNTPAEEPSEGDTDTEDDPSEPTDDDLADF